MLSSPAGARNATVIVCPAFWLGISTDCPSARFEPASDFANTADSVWQITAAPGASGDEHGHSPPVPGVDGDFPALAAIAPVWGCVRLTSGYGGERGGHPSAVGMAMLPPLSPIPANCQAAAFRR